MSDFWRYVRTATVVSKDWPNSPANERHLREIESTTSRFYIQRASKQNRTFLHVSKTTIKLTSSG